jgi:hypothetical protein
LEYRRKRRNRRPWRKRCWNDHHAGLPRRFRLTRRYANGAAISTVSRQGIRWAKIRCESADAFIGSRGFLVYGERVVSGLSPDLGGRAMGRLFTHHPTSP